MPIKYSLTINLKTAKALGAPKVPSISTTFGSARRLNRTFETIGLAPARNSQESDNML
jgi:hypothetical protein